MQIKSNYGSRTGSKNSKEGLGEIKTQVVSQDNVDF